MVPPGPEAWKRLRAPRTYICNIDLILGIFLLLPSSLRNVVYLFIYLFIYYKIVHEVQHHTNITYQDVQIKSIA